MKKKEDINIGKRIKDIRSKLGLNQKEFSDKIGSRVSALSNWENGRNKPNDIMQQRIAKLAGITVEELTNQNKIFNGKEQLITDLNKEMLSIDKEENKLIREMKELEDRNDPDPQIYAYLSSQISQLGNYQQLLYLAIEFIQNDPPLNFYIHNKLVYFLKPINELNEDDYLKGNNYDNLLVLDTNFQEIENMAITDPSEVIAKFKQYSNGDYYFKLSYNAWFKYTFSKQDLMNNVDPIDLV